MRSHRFTPCARIHLHDACACSLHALRVRGMCPQAPITAIPAGASAQNHPMNDRLVLWPVRRHGQAAATLLRGIAAGLVAATGCLAQGAPVDANTATRAELESITGIGPSISDGMLEQ